ncbi:MAG: VWA domain-containing protein, partial [Rhodospirillaceae bacterium]|nr:VWA domain-containing protein [Rhodospirillaceae bacterium]
TSPFGAYGYNPEGVRIGQAESRHRRAVKVWDKREFKDLDGEVELGTRGIKLALRRLRRWGREGEANELDLNGTIRATAANGGVLDLHLRPERRNKVKVLLLLDIGGFTPTTQVMNTYGPDWCLIIVGDATMSPYEITHAGGSVEHWNEEAGSVWLGRLLKHYPKSAWINPRDTQHWGYTASLKLLKQMMGERMFPLTLDGLDGAL